MSRTLFWYIFRDLLRIFLLTSGVLAGILSFGGLLRPLTEYGLDAAQVGKMLGYFMPAMQTFSLPIAALFATTMVYGRLAADNELSACRASGISYLALAAPALVLGLTLAFVSLLCLSFVVPYYNLKVERVIFSNLAELVQGRIENTHQLKLQHPAFGEVTLFAESARLGPRDPNRPDDRVVVLNEPMFVSYRGDLKDPKLRVPTEFYMASQAIAYIRQEEDGIEFSAKLMGGVQFPREFAGKTQGGLGTAWFGPVPMDSPIRENTKFMNIRQLKRLYLNPQESRRVQKLHHRFVQQEQQSLMLADWLGQINAAGRLRLEGAEGETVELLRGDLPARLVGGELVLASKEPADLRQVKLLRHRPGEPTTVDEARQVTLSVEADNQQRALRVQMELWDVRVQRPDGAAAHESFVRRLETPLPPAVAQLWTTRTPENYLERAPGVRISKNDQSRLGRELQKLRNSIQGEINSRLSFAFSCLILVMVGCALGMMLKSGNFLSAFAVSVAPALLCIALVVTGQHVAENAAGSLALGVGLIWSGNVAVLALATWLLLKLQRQ